MANGNDTTPAEEQAAVKDEAAVTVVNTISIMIVGAYIVMMPLWMFWPPTEAPAVILTIINQMTGAWQMAFATVIAYHLGATKTSARSADTNRETIKSLANTAASTASTAATVANTAAVVAAAPAVAAAAGAAQPTTVRTTTETRVDPAPAVVPKADDTEIAITALDIAAQQGVRALDTARESLGQTVPAKVEAHYAELRDALVAQLQSGNTQPKS